MISEDIAQHRKGASTLRGLRTGKSNVESNVGEYQDGGEFVDSYFPTYDSPQHTRMGLAWDRSPMSASTETAYGRLVGKDAIKSERMGDNAVYSEGGEDYAGLLPKYKFDLSTELSNPGLREDIKYQESIKNVPRPLGNKGWHDDIYKLGDKSRDNLWLPRTVEELPLAYSDESYPGKRRAILVDLILSSDDPNATLSLINSSKNWFNETPIGARYDRALYDNQLSFDPALRL
jgi:hypothetical protein